ncbi:F0F1 ATP synthase subunit epsilon [Engelhardtia mirabilis]|uniref:F0F1 ATP synthase subunit epsilon n=1 Tax=Engelhardtia mirabilis TaxID=2528011 RepID=A0A518BEF6_9BACT|nr:F0F1 ATP synthase subunit epsilon [Planctomycetes bacterium Pla133]QDU99589.1 F0F1 ATP synthase subunit epsilon [Planctomycetes bacterium Pla86]
MHLELLLPFGIFAEETAVMRIVAETDAGSFGLLPRRLDCVAALVPGILTYETEAGGEVFVAVDEGVLVKAGLNVSVSVRRAVVDADLARLHEVVAKEFLTVDRREREVRATMARLESGFLHRFGAFRHE